MHLRRGRDQHRLAAHVGPVRLVELCCLNDANRGRLQPHVVPDAPASRAIRVAAIVVLLLERFLLEVDEKGNYFAFLRNKVTMDDIAVLVRHFFQRQHLEQRRKLQVGDFGIRVLLVGVYCVVDRDLLHLEKLDFVFGVLRCELVTEFFCDLNLVFVSELAEDLLDGDTIVLDHVHFKPFLDFNLLLGHFKVDMRLLHVQSCRCQGLKLVLFPEAFVHLDAAAGVDGKLRGARARHARL